MGFIWVLYIFVWVLLCVKRLVGFRFLKYFFPYDTTWVSIGYLSGIMGTILKWRTSVSFLYVGSFLGIYPQQFWNSCFALGFRVYHT
jgi:hypothetical protein